MSDKHRKKQDERFTILQFDPRFRRIQTKEKRREIDDRFKSMFTDERFHLKYDVDKTGKKAQQSTNNFLQEYYELSEEKELGNIKQAQKGKLSENLPSDESESEVDTSSTEYSSEDENETFPWGELDNNEEETDDSTYRLAVCNLDWDQVTSKDLFVLLNSFKPPDGFVKTVKIYKSDFGKKCMKEDDENGPKFDRVIKKHFGDDDKGHQTRVASELARDYELRKFKYYYAVVECDSAETASKIYNECEGRELEHLGLRLDLRYISNDMVFDDEPYNATDGVNDMATYEPTMGINASVSHFRPTCSWEEGDKSKRTKMLKKAFEVDNNDELEAYLGSSSSNESDNEENETTTGDAMGRYKELLDTINEKANKSKDKKVLQFSWKTSIDDDDEEKKPKKVKAKSVEKNKRKVISESSDEDSEQEIAVKSKKNKKKTAQEEPEDDISPAEKSKMKAELELLTMDNENEHLLELLEGKPDNTISKKKKSFKEKDMSKFKFNSSDPRFAAIGTNPLFSLDPSDHRFKRSKGTEQMLRENWNSKFKKNAKQKS